MPRVSQDTLKKLATFIDSLPDEARNKCALCTEGCAFANPLTSGTL